MINPINKIYSEVKKSVSSLCTNTSRTYKSTPQKMPFLYFKVLGSPTTCRDLDNNENAINFYEKHDYHPRMYVDIKKL